MIIYFDSSALIKSLINEPGSEPDVNQERIPHLPSIASLQQHTSS